ncbi:hypothetical protein MPDQ_004449 [Monascus purpureus]|uniref:Major facilitator superfamily (MFS) profile domain-containing protein n=1 Tax=Monascus purpureus TaxID=5098 RepID=A0A507QY51_MONPU|nr:hypothetical protein MPDQ_004449 [Monascus purpureus]
MTSFKKEYEGVLSPEHPLPPDLAPDSVPDALVNDVITTHDKNHPIHWPTWLKWLIAITYSLLQVLVTMQSTSYVSVETIIQEKFGGSTQVIALGQSMFIAGTAVGPAFMGPLSDIGGRKWVYVVSVFIYGLCQIGCALALNLPMMIIFMLLCGIAGSTALSNVAGTIADLFGDADHAAQPMAFLIFAGFFVVVMSFIPETLPRMVIARAAKKELAANEADVVVTPPKVNVLKEMRFVTTMTFRIMFTEPIVAFLGLFNGFAYGLLFLYLDGVYDVFAFNNHLSYIGADLTFLNFVVGVGIMFVFFAPIQTWLYSNDRKRHGKARPEARFLISLVAVWGFPISLFWFAFTSNGKTSFWSPVVAGGMLGVSDPLLWLNMLNYITDTYPNVAASAVAAFLIPSFALAAGFVHIGIVMFDRMSTTWAFATLAFISLGIVALVYVLYFFGPALRRMSKLARRL